MKNWLITILVGLVLMGLTGCSRDLKLGDEGCESITQEGVGIEEYIVVPGKTTVTILDEISVEEQIQLIYDYLGVVEYEKDWECREECHSFWDGSNRKCKKSCITKTILTEKDRFFNKEDIFKPAEILKVEIK